MKVLIISYVDDNFGDNLIRICFENLLKVVFKNLNIDSYEISRMNLKNIDHSLICQADIIFFAGGGLFGLSYLNFFDYLNEIITIADQNQIPVVFSSIGINNMDATPETENVLRNILKHKCIKYIAVRENIDLFKSYAGSDCHYEIEQVCDPAVWTQYIYHNLSENPKTSVGINVVRGGLFKDNKKNWNLQDEMNYLNELKNLLDEANIDYKFYTNGSLLDNNTLHYFADQYDIPDDYLIFPHSTREFIEAVKSFNCVSAIRMHSAIVSYAFDIPSICLIWNDKIPLFYRNIHQDNRSISLDEWNAPLVFENIKILLNDKSYHKDETYLMTLYQYLYKVISEIFHKNETIFNFSQIVNELSTYKVSDDEDLFDYRFKCDKAEHHYLSRFMELEKKKSEIKELKSKIKQQNETFENQQKVIQDQKQQSNEQKSFIANQKKIIKKQKDELNYLNNLFFVRVYKKLKKMFSK